MERNERGVGGYTNERTLNGGRASSMTRYAACFFTGVELCW